MNNKFWLIIICGLSLTGMPKAVIGMTEASDDETAVETSLLSTDDIKQAALKTLFDLANAYSQKMRSAFMRLVSDNFRGDLFAFEDALLKDFRNYRDVNLDFIPDTVTVEGTEAEVGFRYNMSVVNDQGTQTLYSGTSAYEFGLEDGKMKLVRMATPILFGNSLPQSENPIAKPQGTDVIDMGSAPGESGTSVVTGEGTLTQGVSGFRFSSESNMTETSADVFMRGTGTGLEINVGGGLDALGTGSLSTVTSLTSDPSDQFIDPIQVGDLVAVKTLDGKYAVIRITGIVTNVSISFEYKYQPNGSTSF